MRTFVRYALLGSAVNVGVAWACALGVAPDHGTLSPHDDVETSIIDGRVRHAYTMRNTGVRRHVSWWRDDATAPPVIEDQHGWPMYSMACRLTTVMTPGDCYAVAVGGGIGVGAVHRAPPFPVRSTGTVPGQPDFYRARAAPLVPVWPGFVVNALLYAVLLLALLRGPAVARAYWRAAHDRCGSCGYRRVRPRGSRCPECGAPRPRVAVVVGTSSTCATRHDQHPVEVS